MTKYPNLAFYDEHVITWLRAHTVSVFLSAGDGSRRTLVAHSVNDLYNLIESFDATEGRKPPVTLAFTA